MARHRRRAALLVACAWACAAPLVHTGSEADGDAGRFHFAMRSEPKPVGLGAAAFVVDVRALDGVAPVDALEAQLVMPAHGHAASGTASITRASDTSFRIEGWSLPMTGAWELDLIARAASGDDEVRFAIDVR